MFRLVSSSSVCGATSIVGTKSLSFAFASDFRSSGVVSTPAPPITVAFSVLPVPLSDQVDNEVSFTNCMF